MENIQDFKKCAVGGVTNNSRKKKLLGSGTAIQYLKDKKMIIIKNCTIVE